jgi:hypothetical protein
VDTAVAAWAEWTTESKATSKALPKRSAFLLSYANNNLQLITYNMDTKIQFKLGGVEFLAEGPAEWVSSQLDKVIEKAPKLLALAPLTAPQVKVHEGGHQEMKSDPEVAGKTLVAFLKEKNATTRQVTKFLATAIWLEAKGKNRITTRDITQALQDANQSRLGNPANCLNQNVSKGHCEKDGKEFFVTVEGKAAL